MIRHRIALQDSNTARVSNLIEAVAELGASASFNRIRVAMAYATCSGCKSLVSRLSAHVKNWRRMEKQWLVSFDFGRSEVPGLKYLQRLPHSEVKVPDASKPLANHLIPVRCFHAKTYIFDVTKNPNDPL